MRSLILRHRDARGTLRVEWAGGHPVVLHALVASPRVQHLYERVLRSQTNRPGGETGCQDFQRVRNDERSSVLLHGPCTCAGVGPPCDAIRESIDQFHRRVPGAARLTEISFEQAGTELRGYLFASRPPSAVGPTLRLHPMDFGKLARKAAILSNADRNTLWTAERLGYYSTPRRCTMNDLARELKITKSAVFYRLQKVERLAIEGLLESAPAAPSGPAL